MTDFDQTISSFSYNKIPVATTSRVVRRSKYMKESDNLKGEENSKWFFSIIGDESLSYQEKI